MTRPQRQPDALHRMRVAESLQAQGGPDAAGAAGRGIQRGPGAQAPMGAGIPHNGAVGGMLPAGPGMATPFASSQVDMGSNVAPSEANSTRVLAIVFALFFASGLAAVAAALILLLGFLAWNRDANQNSGVVKAGPEHVRDSGLVEDPDLQQVIARQQRRRQDEIDNTVKDPMAEMFGGIGAGPVTVFTKGPGREQYRQIEILCNSVGFRKRASIVKDRAYVEIVPAARCRLVFQGNVPVKSWVTGGDTVTCSFEPSIVCR
ncbi:MAG: hypothetical protein H6736_00890 [Alphaproteobacteria bacterium]|nr:hypothetical protein [Alphaproteobacteria bacterium]MCB9690347.1 hypothetical protein [Alphaproteobacteria bacterium]